MFVKYTGTSDIRTISKSEWGNAGNGFDHEAVRWDAATHFVAELEDEAAQWLLDNSPDQFREATDSDLAKLDQPAEGEEEE